ncbi:tRNA-dihydrouridine(20) synthase [NAD(P)+]-like [Allomyces javanicus]|nr:tRNA-dihydrouridine(20) synthase [NAD(P)+]-like [Allomyces javanicus]
MRLLAKDYGADYVYGPEIVDKRIIGCDRIVNELLGTVDFVKKGVLNFRCLPSEKPYLVFQLGTADPDLAVQAAKTVAQDVAYVDVNCGCPKRFSLQGGMGAALLYEPDKLIKILTNLVEHAGVPITCKIRMLEDKDATLALVERIINTGISALAVHCRTRDMRPTDPGKWEIWHAIAERFGDRTPIIANGDIFEGDDMDRAFEIPGIASVMLARSAQSNPSVFRHPEPRLPIDDVIRQYIRYAIKYDSIYQNAKYVLMQMDHDMKSDRGKKLASAKSLRTIAELWGIEAEHDQLMAEREARRVALLAEKATTVTVEDENVSGSKRPASPTPLERVPTTVQSDGLGHIDWNKDGGVESECPYIPNAPYIPKKRKTDAGDGVTADPAAPNAPSSEPAASTAPVSSQP